MSRFWQKSVCASALSALLLIAAQARGGVASEAQVTQALGTAEMVENFTEFHAAPSTSYAIDTQTLNAQTMDQNQGPGLVQPDLSFSVQPYPTCDMNWWGPGSNGNAALELGFLLGTTSASGSITFAQPTPAFGVDLIGLSASNTQPDVSYTLEMYGAGNTLIDTQQATTNGTTPGFFGYVAPAGITQVEILSNIYAQPVGINNLMYSVPEPGSLSILAAGGLLSLRRRKRASAAVAGPARMH